MLAKMAKRYRSEELSGSRIILTTHPLNDLSTYTKAAETLNLHRASIDYVQSSDFPSQKADGTRYTSRLSSIASTATSGRSSSFLSLSGPSVLG